MSCRTHCTTIIYLCSITILCGLSSNYPFSFFCSNRLVPQAYTVQQVQTFPNMEESMWIIVCRVSPQAHHSVLWFQIVCGTHLLTLYKICLGKGHSVYRLHKNRKESEDAGEDVSCMRRVEMNVDVEIIEF